MRLFVLLIALLLFAVSTFAHAQQRAEVLVLGSFHMANPGRDIHNSQVDDVLAPMRQAEIAQVVQVLRRFRPTKIAIESNTGGARPKQYAEYLAGRYELTRNEIDQLGFRLAKELGHSAIYPVDEDGDFPFYRVQNWAIANGRKAQFDSAQAAVGARVKAQSEYLQSHTILQTLQLLNSDSLTRRSLGEYYVGYLPFGQPYEYAGADLIASWFQRNLRIYHNIRALITSPNDRILVIYGYGHLGWLQQIASADPAIVLRRLSDMSAQD